jgi:LysR family cys regulon transcriptional activator
MVLQGDADVAVATETIADCEGLIAVPCFQWEHMVITLPDHPLYQETVLAQRQLTLEMLARYPIVTYDSAFAGRIRIDEGFQKRNVVPDVVLAAIDADVIKTYVETGMGVGILAGMAFDPMRDVTLRSIPAGHLFGHNVTHLAVRKGSYLRGYLYTFIELLAPGMDREMMERLLLAPDSAPQSYQL